MNAATRELCEELHKLSGWNEKGMPFYQTAPAYDLGYLLRKLPDEATSKKHGGYHYFYMHHSKPYWYAYYGEINTTKLMAWADTPEDAAGKLCIVLIKEGIIKV